MAKLVSTWSKDPSTQTGAVIVSADRKDVFIGYNGFPRRMLDIDSLYANREEKYSRIIHCEMNAMQSAGRMAEGSTLYTYPFISCDRCFVHMVQGGIVRFVAPEPSADIITRWGDSLAKVRKYAAEMSLPLIEVPYNKADEKSKNTNQETATSEGSVGRHSVKTLFGTEAVIEKGVIDFNYKTTDVYSTAEVPPGNLGHIQVTGQGLLNSGIEY